MALLRVGARACTYTVVVLAVLCSASAVTEKNAVSPLVGSNKHVELVTRPAGLIWEVAHLDATVRKWSGMRGRLLSISSAHESAAVVSFLSELRGRNVFSEDELSNVWFGGRRGEHAHGQWGTEDGSPFWAEWCTPEAPALETSPEDANALMAYTGSSYCMSSSKGYQPGIKSFLVEYVPSRDAVSTVHPTLKFAVLIIRPPGYLESRLFHWIAETFHYAFIELGYDSVQTDKLDYHDRQYLVFACNLLPSFPVVLPPNAIIYQMEQVLDDPKGWWSPEMVQILQRAPLWDYSKKNIQKLAQFHGIENVSYVPMGYSPQLRRIPDVEEDIDVLFYGSVNDRRRKIIEDLMNRGVNVKFVYGLFPPELDDYLARSKIILNVHFFESKILEQARVVYLLANRRFVISEPGADLAENEAFSKSIVFTEYDKVVDTCIWYLDNPEEMRRVAETGFRFIASRPHTSHVKAVAERLAAGQRRHY